MITFARYADSVPNAIFYEDRQINNLRNAKTQVVTQWQDNVTEPSDTVRAAGITRWSLASFRHSNIASVWVRDAVSRAHDARPDGGIGRPVAGQGRPSDRT